MINDCLVYYLINNYAIFNYVFYKLFKLMVVEKISETQYKVYGNLTMRGIKKEIILEGEKTTDSNDNLFFNAISIIDRQDFGISWNRPFQKIVGMMVSNEVN